MAELFKSNEIAVVFLLDVKQTVLFRVLQEPGFPRVTSGKPQKCVEKPAESSLFYFDWGSDTMLLIFFFYFGTTPPQLTRVRN
jgi:hypothetical protein